jgi:mono/diheme cytochrome c family protein
MINGGRRGDSLWLFSLDGTIESLPADAAAVPAAAGTQGGAAPAAAPADGAASLAEGARIYRQFCLACHGEGGTGGQGNGASLETIGGDARLVATIASNGKNTMPAFRRTLTPEQLRDVAQYIAGELFNTGHGN